MKTHLPDEARPGKMRCGQDRVTPLGPLKLAANASECDCRMCLNLAFFGTNNVRDGGTWIRQ